MVACSGGAALEGWWWARRKCRLARRVNGECATITGGALTPRKTTRLVAEISTSCPAGTVLQYRSPAIFTTDTLRTTQQKVTSRLVSVNALCAATFVRANKRGPEGSAFNGIGVRWWRRAARARYKKTRRTAHMRNRAKRGMGV